MSCLGGHLAITESEAMALRACKFDQELIEAVSDLENFYFENFQQYYGDCDKSWDGMHRALTDGLFDFTNGEYPLSHVVMGGERLYQDTDWIVVMKTASEVRDIAKALDSIDEATFKSRYWSIPQKKCDWDLSADDCVYTWDNLRGVRELFNRAAAENRYVLFSASQ